MNSYDDERSGGDGDGGGEDLSLPRPPPALAYATDDAAPPLDKEPAAAVPDRPLDPSLTTTQQPPSSEGHIARDATRSAPLPNGVRSQPQPRLSDGAHFEGQGREPARPITSSPSGGGGGTPDLTPDEHGHWGGGAIGVSTTDDEDGVGPSAAAYFESMDEDENTLPKICDERRDVGKEGKLGEADEDAVPLPEICDVHGDVDVEEKMEDPEVDSAPLPPEMIAASFEEVKPELIIEDVALVPEEQIAAVGEIVHAEDENAPLPPETIAASFEDCDEHGDVDAEEKMEESEEDSTPLPPEMIAASFEDVKPVLIIEDVALVPEEQIAAEGEIVHAEDENPPLPPETIVASFEEAPVGDNNKAREEVEYDAPPPSEMTAASYEEIDAAEKEANATPPKSIEDDNGAQVPARRIASVHMTEESIRRDIINSIRPLIDEAFDNNETSVTTENREIHNDPPSSLINPPSTAATSQPGASSTTPTPERSDYPSLAASNYGHVEITILPTPEPMSRPRPNFDQDYPSLPLLEATAVDSEIYHAVIMSDTQDNDARGWSRISQQYRVIFLVLVLVAIAAIIAVVVVVAGNGDEPIAPVTTIAPVPLSWKQQGPAIVGDAENDYFGSSVAFSADAKILVVGAPFSNKNKGYVKVYRTEDDGGNRVQLGKTIEGDEENDNLGRSVNISPDGNVLAIGSPATYDSNRPGYVRVFLLNSRDDLGTGSWKQLGQNITGKIGYEFGSSVSLSGDGKTIAVGAQYADGNTGEDSGHVRIFHLVDNDTRWEQIGQDIDGEVAYDLSGSSVSLSADGATVVIGSPGHEEYGYWAGQVRVYRIDSEGSSWKQLGQSFYGMNENDAFGMTVNISPNSNTLAVGLPGAFESDTPGYVRVFSLERNDDFDSGTWKQFGRDIAGQSAKDLFGCSISLSDDGKTLAVGARFNYENGVYSGYVRVYRMDDSSWTQFGDDIKGEEADKYSKSSVSLSGDGKTIAIGWDYSGQVKVFAMK